MVWDGVLKANLKKNSRTNTLFLLQWCCTYWNLYFLTSSSLIQFSNSVPCILPYPLKCCTRYPAKTYFGKNFKQHRWSHSLAYSNSFVVWVVLNQDLLQFMSRIYSCRNRITSCIWAFFCMQSPKCYSCNGTYLWKVTDCKWGWERTLLQTHSSYFYIHSKTS